MGCPWSRNASPQAKSSAFMLSHARGGCIPLDGRIFGTRTRRAQPPLQRVGGRSLSPERPRLASRRTHLRSRFSWRLPRELARLRLAPPCLESEPTWLSSYPITKGTARSPLDDGTCQLMLIDNSFDFRTDASGKDPYATAPLFGSTTNSCRARSCQVVGSLICMTPYMACTCITALNFSSSLCVATPLSPRSRGGIR